MLRKEINGHLHLALRERTGRDVWQNLYEFYGTETDKPTSDRPLTDVPGEMNELIRGGVFVGPPTSAQQLLSHQRIGAIFHQISLPETNTVMLPDGLNWYLIEQIKQLPKPALIASYLKNQFG